MFFNNFVYKMAWRKCFHGLSLYRRSATSSSAPSGFPQHLVDCSDQAADDSRDFVLIPDFITPDEEQSLMGDVGTSFRRLRYQYAHWDQAIEGYRETEKSQWQAPSQYVIDRLKRTATSAVDGKRLEALPGIHVLDLAKDGYIRPHVDSIKHCGDVIAGVSLLSPCVMKLQCEDNAAKLIHTLLLPRSLYIMRGVIRYNYSHAILSLKDSQFRGNAVLKDRRVSLVCRTTPA